MAGIELNRFDYGRSAFRGLAMDEGAVGWRVPCKRSHASNLFLGTRKILALIFTGMAICFPLTASAYTECSVTLEKMFSGDDGSVWFHFTNGGSAYVLQTDPDTAVMTSFGITGLISSRPMVIRYNANGVSCTSFGRSDVVGLYLK
jgi:hypothetical protein